MNFSASWQLQFPKLTLLEGMSASHDSSQITFLLFRFKKKALILLLTVYYIFRIETFTIWECSLFYQSFMEEVASHLWPMQSLNTCVVIPFMLVF